MRTLEDYSPPPLSHPSFVHVSRAVNTTDNNDPSPDGSSLNALSTGFNPSMAIIVVVLVSAFFFMAFFTLYARRCSTSDRSPRNNRGQAARAYDRPPRGLDKALVESLPLVTFSVAKTKQEGSGVTECVVCLSEFEDNETLRLLPKCNHVFHQECIDMWLFSHTTCPLCRQSLLDEEAEDRDSGSGAEEGIETAISVQDSEGRTIDDEAYEANSSTMNAAGPTHRRESSTYGTILGSSFRSKSRNRGRIRRSNSTGHSLIRIARPLPTGEGATQPPLPLSVAVPLNSRDFHRSRSYTPLSDSRVAESRVADSSKGDQLKDTSSKGSWRAFSFRRAFDSKRSATHSRVGEASSSSEARIGYGDDENRGYVSSMRRTIMRLTGMDV